jgi:hypothetical protein
MWKCELWSSHFQNSSNSTSKKYEVKSKRFSDSFTDSGNEKNIKELEHSIHVLVEFVLFWSSHFQNCPNSTLKKRKTFDFIFPSQTLAMKKLKLT